MLLTSQDFAGELMLEQESATDIAAYRRVTRTAPILTRPEPGSFYQIQAGEGGLLTTAGRAYGVGPGGERLRFAQRISVHPLNRALIVPPGNAFERKYFPSGLVSFLKQFTCSVPQRRAGPGESRCYGIVWIPPSRGGGPFKPPVFFLSPAKARSIAETVQVLLEERLGSGSHCKRRFADLVVGEDDRMRVEDRRRSRAPFRWACKILAIFAPTSTGERPIGEASGVLLTPNLLATNAHVVDSDLDVPEALLVIPGFSKADPPEVTQLDDDSAPFGVWLVLRRKPGGASNFHIAPEFRSHGDDAADYAAVDLSGAKAVGNFSGVRRDGWLTVDRRLALSAPQAANPAGESAPVTTDPAPTRQLLRTLGGEKLMAAGYPADRVCEMMLATDRIRPLEFIVYCADQAGRQQCFNVYPDGNRHAKVGSRLDTTFGNSGGPVWVERLVARREGSKRTARRQFVLAGLLQGGTHPVSERIDFRKSSSGRIVYLPPPDPLEMTNHTSSEVVVLTPFVLSRLLRPSLMLPA